MPAASSLLMVLSRASRLAHFLRGALFAFCGVGPGDVSDIGGPRRIRYICLIGGWRLEESLHSGPVLQFSRGSGTMEPWELRNDSLTGRALHAGGEEEKA